MTPNMLLKHVKELEEKNTSENLYNKLSIREREIFKYLAEGLNIKEIAGELFLSPKTVESHKYHIMKKLQAKSMVDLTKIAIKKNLIEV